MILRNIVGTVRYSICTRKYSEILCRCCTILCDIVARVYLDWSGDNRKIQIRLYSTVAYNGDIVLPGVYLSLCFMRQGCVNAPRQNNNMSHSQFASSFDSCAATYTLTNKNSIIFVFCKYKNVLYISICIFYRMLLIQLLLFD